MVQGTQFLFFFLSMYSDRVGRTASVSRMFDMKVETGNASYTFSNILREEFDNLYEFLKGKDLPVPDLKDIEVCHRPCSSRNH
jgi:hypothetical protein